MNSGFYAAAAGLLARVDALDVAANNLANVSTVGFKSQREFYEALMAHLKKASLGSVNRAINNFGVLGGARFDFRQGNLERTGGDSDVAIEGPGFFTIQTRAGVRYTRNGNFHVDPSGRLATAAGDLVLGEDGPLRVPPGQLSIGAEGTLSVQGATAGRLKLVDFGPSTAMVQEGNSYFAVSAGASPNAAAVKVRQGMLEASNLNAVVGAVGLIAIQRQAEMLQRALSIFHTEFNRTAAEELPRMVG